MLTKDDLKEIEKIVKPIKKDLSEVKVELKEVGESTAANTASLMNLEKKIGIYNDALDIERKRIDKHEERLAHLETL